MNVTLEAGFATNDVSALKWHFIILRAVLPIKYSYSLWSLAYGFSLVSRPAPMLEPDALPYQLLGHLLAKSRTESRR